MSKVESDAGVQAFADKLNVPWTIANPATVIGDSVNGESEQMLGLATTIRDLLTGKLLAVHANAATFIPVVAVDYLARFMSLLPATEAARGKSFWILDDDTPALPDLHRVLGGHHGVTVPRLRIPVWIIKRLPDALTQADPETLSFLSSDRYPTGPANDLAYAHGLHQPNVSTTLTRWSEYLAENYFARPSN
ncbi:nucleoside-diphosphate-sugar epimerase [Cryobacterium sp. MP_M5]|uniref:SDR family oxidoreductase n=1 Tax=unclassified Cryobacterium TaxID=2649013 RepID=UPI001A33D6D7|nr:MULTISPECIES: SDR family oxidoreductase [unclassified Cryobacterium]MBG6058259.1 nucleoside-diphosphate-sugar epimerase [Cryobacterium sp. MP_M3]MEC5176494.1 nucleoside-diphosphate-sugar epimerase [Cryobacterium sp. MP_M5]